MSKGLFGKFAGKETVVGRRRLGVGVYGLRQRFIGLAVLVDLVCALPALASPSAREQSVKIVETAVLAIDNDKMLDVVASRRKSRRTH